MTDWDGAFRWTGLPEVTWYYLDIEKADGIVLLERWYQATAVCSGTACVLTPPELQTLPNGDYRWRVYDWDAAYGSGPWTAYTNFTLSQTCFGLTTAMNPSGKGTLGVTPPANCGTKYQGGMVVTLTVSTNVRYRFDHWSGDASGTTNPVTVTMNAPRNVTANLTATPVTLSSPSGAVSNWDGSFRWTGLAEASWYNVDVERADGTVLLQKWYPAGSVCSGLSCVLVPSELQGLANGDYRWRMYDWGEAYGDGPWTPYLSFTLSRLGIPEVAPIASPTLTGTVGVTPTPTRMATPIRTPTVGASATFPTTMVGTATPTVTIAKTGTPVTLSTSLATSTRTATPASTPTPKPRATATYTNTAVPTPTPPATVARRKTPSITPTPTRTHTSTFAATVTPGSTATPIQTTPVTATPKKNAKPTSTPTPSLTQTRMKTSVSVTIGTVTPTGTPFNTPSLTATPTSIKTPVGTMTPAATATRKSKETPKTDAAVSAIPILMP